MVVLAESSLASPMTDKRSLLDEQRRLAKLWDAFKKQEDEYRALERERDELWSRLQEIEKDRETVGDLGEARTRLTRLEKENERMRTDVSDLGARLQEAQRNFHEEQARLAKLYKVYQDTEARLQDAWKEVNAWRGWWSKFGGKITGPGAQAAKRIKRAK